MKLYVKLEEKCVAVPCADGATKISWLIEEALERMEKLESSGNASAKSYTLMSSDQLITYCSNDVISDVLDDKQFVSLKCGNNCHTNDLHQKEGQNGVSKIAIYAYDKIQQRINASVRNSTDYTKLFLNRFPTPGLRRIKPLLQEEIVLDGLSLSTAVLWSLSAGTVKIKISTGAEQRVKQSRRILDDIVEQNRVVYGVTTGFGKFARVVIGQEDLEQLQINLIESHCAGVGNPLSPERTRMLLALRINVLCKGYSGISPESLKTMVKAFNASCLSWVPEKGTVGASGDLAPLSHMALGLMGKGKMWSPSSGWSDAKHVLEANGIPPLQLLPKEGLALINGTQFIAAMGSEAVERSRNIALQADVVTALTLEALQGTSRAFDAAIHEARPHKGQMAVAARMRKLLRYGGVRSEISAKHTNCDRVQDAYTLRCCAQVHGIVHDTVEFVQNVLNVELNSATDNPMVLINRQETISGGNFHGEYPAKALDYLAIGVHEISSMSERRIERLCNPAYSDLPAFLVNNGGLNSGFMIPHCTAAALVSENKGLCHPASVDSLSTSAGQEDHVSMGGWAARKALRVVENVEHVVAIELLCACQGIEFHRPLKTTEALEAVHSLVRSVVPSYDKDRVHSHDIEAVVKLLRGNKIWEAVKPHMDSPIEIDFGKLSCSPTSSFVHLHPSPQDR